MQPQYVLLHMKQKLGIPMYLIILLENSNERQRLIIICLIHKAVENIKSRYPA